MSTSKPRHDRLSRRELFKGTIAASAALGLTSARNDNTVTAKRSNTIIRENRLPGTTDWQLTYTKIDPPTKFRSPLIEGYVSKASLGVGETLDFMVSTNPGAAFTIDLYRLGYYDGKGGRHLKTLGPFDGTTQADPAIDDFRIRDCQWSPSTRLTIPKTGSAGSISENYP